jgi:uncharacterized protein
MSDDLSPLLAELDTLLFDIPLEIDGMILGSVEGLIAGVAVLPQLAPQSEWMPLVWGGGDAAFPDDAAKSARMIELLQARRTEVIGQFLADGGAYDPVFDLDIDGSFLWEVWLEGFRDAVSLQPAAFDAWMASANEDVAAAALGLDVLIRIMDGEKLPRKAKAEIVAHAPALVCHYAETLYRCQRGLAYVAPI